MTAGKSEGRLASGQEGDSLVFVVDVSSFTEKGFIGTSSFAGHKVDLEFDDNDAGLDLTQLMARKIHAKKGSPVSIVVEDGDKPQVVKTVVGSVGKRLRISNAKVYYAVGREGGAVVRIAKS